MLSRECNRSIRAAGFTKIAPIHEHKAVSMLVGTAIDYRIRAYFNRHIYETDAIMRGLAFLCNLKELKEPHINPETGTNIEWVSDILYFEEFIEIPNPWYWRRRKRVADRFISSFENFVAKANPERRKLASEAEERLCRYCILFAYLDFIGRSPSGSSAMERMIELGSPNVRSMLRAVDPNIAADVAALSTRFYQQHRAMLRKFKNAAIGGTLAGSEDIGGADFDLIVDGCLIDVRGDIAAQDHDHATAAARRILAPGLRRRSAHLIGGGHAPSPRLHSPL